MNSVSGMKVPKSLIWLRVLCRKPSLKFSKVCLLDSCLPKSWIMDIPERVSDRKLLSFASWVRIALNLSLARRAKRMVIMRARGTKRDITRPGADSSRKA